LGELNKAERTLLSVPDFQDPDSKARVATFGRMVEWALCTVLAILLQSKRVANKSGPATVAPRVPLTVVLFPFGIALHSATVVSGCDTVTATAGLLAPLLLHRRAAVAPQLLLPPAMAAPTSTKPCLVHP